MAKIWRVLFMAGVSFLVFGTCLLTLAWGDCRLEQNSHDSQVMLRRLVGPCTGDDRLRLALPGEEVLQALLDGRGVELEGIVLTGDVMLDRLPVEAITPNELAIPVVGERLSSGRVEGIRRIPGPILLRQVEIQGVIATNFVTQGYLLVAGPVRILDSTIQRSIDLSRTAFLEKVAFSRSHILHEAFFIQSVFTKGANFEGVNFGTHTRFHKAVFGSKAAFSGSTFQGLAELLEVVFHHEAEFSNARFVMGTGFSGSRFLQQAVFIQAGFEREAYFRFAEFDGEANFQGASFGAAADFTESKFEADWDFAGVQFAEVPHFPKTQTEALSKEENRGKNARVQAGLFALLFLILLIVVYRARRSQRKLSKRSS